MLGKQTDVLKSPRDAAPRNLVRTQAVDAFAFEMNLAGSRLVNAGQQIEDRSLARAVRSDQAVDLAALDLHVQLVDGDQTAETNRGLRSAQRMLAVAFWISAALIDSLIPSHSSAVESLCSAIGAPVGSADGGGAFRTLARALEP